MPSATGMKAGVPYQTSPYRCKLTEVIEEVSEYGDQWKWVFEVSQGEYEGKSIFGWCNDVPATPKSKKAKWLGSLVGKSTLDTDEKVDTDDYIGKEYDVLVNENDKGAVRIDRFSPVNSNSKKK